MDARFLSVWRIVKVILCVPSVQSPSDPQRQFAFSAVYLQPLSSITLDASKYVLKIFFSHTIFDETTMVEIFFSPSGIWLPPSPMNAWTPRLQTDSLLRRQHTEEGDDNEDTDDESEKGWTFLVPIADLETVLTERGLPSLNRNSVCFFENMESIDLRHIHVDTSDLLSYKHGSIWEYTDPPKNTEEEKYLYHKRVLRAKIQLLYKYLSLLLPADKILEDMEEI